MMLRWQKSRQGLMLPKKKSDLLMPGSTTQNLKGYIKPNDENYQQLRESADKKIKGLNEKIQTLEREKYELGKKKGLYTDSGSNQGALFEPNVKYDKILENSGGLANFDVNEKTQAYKTKEGEEIQYNSVADNASNPEIPGLFSEEGESQNPDDRLGEVCWMERQMNELPNVSFTGESQIKSTADVAYLFRHLEQESSENVFVVITTQKGVNHILYVSTGSTSASIVDYKPIYAAIKQLGARRVCLVHNHPSGTLFPSEPDKEMHRTLKRVVDISGGKTEVMNSVIINLDTGKFVEFNESDFSTPERPTSAKNEKAIKVSQFNRQILYTPSSEKTKITSSRSVAKFLSQQKRGLVPKLGIIVLDRANMINRYIMDEFRDVATLADKIMTNVAKSGEAVILVTNDKFEAGLARALKAKLGKTVEILDMIEVAPSPEITTKYRSFSDEGLMEPSVAYGENAKSEHYFEYVPYNEIEKYYNAGRYNPDTDLDDLADYIDNSGIKYPLELTVDDQGKATITKGNEIIVAIRSLGGGIKKIPVRIVDGRLSQNDLIYAKPLPKVGQEELIKRLKERTSSGDPKSMNGPYTKGFTVLEGNETYGNGEVREERPKNDVKVRRGHIISLQSFRKKILKRNTKEEKQTISEINELLRDPKTSDKDRAELISVKDAILEQKKEDKKAFRQYIKDNRVLEKAAMTEELKDFSLEELTEIYNLAIAEEGTDSETKTLVKEKIAHFINQQQVEKLRENPVFKEEKVHSKDMNWTDVWFKSLSEIGEKFPLLQGLNNIFRQKSLDQIEEASAQKRKLEKFGKAVIRERNGLLGSLKNVFTSDSAKYFDFMDQDGQLRTDTSGLSKAQKDFLEYLTELTKNKIPDEVTGSQLLMTDKGFQETYRTEGLLAALNVQLGGNNNLDSEITYTDPLTKREETVSYYDAQQNILAYGKTHPLKALWELTKLAYKAKKARTKNDYYIKKNGQLTSKFDNKPRPVDKGYSKDFYRAAMAYIDDITHVKYMKDVVPVVDAVELFYKRMGIEEGKDFKNVLKFLEEWKFKQIYQESTKPTNPVADAALRSLRHGSSLTVMAFNATANAMNVAIGWYNTIRKDGFIHFLNGQKRFFVGGKRGAYGLVNQYSLDILKKYKVVNIDASSNPRATVGKLFSQLAFIGLRSGEVNIQGSEFLGHMSEKEYNSFEYDDEGELQIKKSLSEEETKELKEKISEYKKKVSDVQGKYSEKDSRNFMRFEAGRSASQYKLWAFDWFRTRFGQEIINSDGKVERGSWNYATKLAVKELKDDFSKHGIKTAWKNQQTKENLTGAMFVAVLLAATYADDDDEKVKKQALSVDNALHQLLFVYDPQQLKYLIQSPIASFSLVNDFLDATSALIDHDNKKFEKHAKKLIPFRKAADLLPEKK
jgi:DNA repair protein RadC